MTQNYSVSLEKIIAAHNLEIIYLPKPADEILITTNEVNRPGIVMTGYTDYFDAERISDLRVDGVWLFAEYGAGKTAPGTPILVGTASGCGCGDSRAGHSGLLR